MYEENKKLKKNMIMQAVIHIWSHFKHILCMQQFQQGIKCDDICLVRERFTKTRTNGLTEQIIIRIQNKSEC